MELDDGTTALTLVSGLLAAGLLAAAFALDLPERWMTDGLLVAAGVALGVLVTVSFRSMRDDDESRKHHAVLAAALLAYAAVSLYNAYVLEILSGPVRALTMVVVGMVAVTVVRSARIAVGAGSDAASG